MEPVDTVRIPDAACKVDVGSSRFFLLLWDIFAFPSRISCHADAPSLLVEENGFIERNYLIFTVNPGAIQCTKISQ